MEPDVEWGCANGDTLALSPEPAGNRGTERVQLTILATLSDRLKNAKANRRAVVLSQAEAAQLEESFVEEAEARSEALDQLADANRRVTATLAVAREAIQELTELNGLVVLRGRRQPSWATRWLFGAFTLNVVRKLEDLRLGLRAAQITRPPWSRA